MPALPSSDPRLSALLAPIAAVMDDALARMELRPSQLPELVAGGRRGPLVRLTREGLELSARLEGPDPLLDEDRAWAEQVGPPALAIDRWRRAAGAVLEGVALWAMAERAEIAPWELPLTWWTLGPAADAVDRAAPSLGWLWPEAADLLARPHVGLANAPRRAAWLYRWLGDRAWVPGQAASIEEETWTEFGAWCRDGARGLRASCPLPLDTCAPSADLAWKAEALSHGVVRVEAGAHGARLSVQGGHLVGPTTLASGQVATLVVGTVAGGKVRVVADTAGPKGHWVLASGTIDGQLGAARGIELTISSEGQLDLVLADAYVGPPDAETLDVASKFGVSGSGRGRWRLDHLGEPGSGGMTFSDLQLTKLTLHPKGRSWFAVPATPFLGPVERFVRALGDTRWAYGLTDEELSLRGDILEHAFYLRFRKPEG